MFQTIVNAFKIPDLRKKLLFTLMIILLHRVGSIIPVPFINIDTVADAFANNGGTLFGMIDIFSGGAFSHATLFALSIMPYINASIIMQLLTIAIPALERMQKEGGDEGRKKIAAITRYVTVGLGLMLSFFYYLSLKNTEGVLTQNSVWAAIVIIVSMTAGTAVVMWLGELITEYGIGNGISIILFAGIISRGPHMVQSVISLMQGGGLNWFKLLGIVIVAIAVVAFVVFMSNAERRLPVQYAKRVVGRKTYGGQSTFIPLKLAMTGVMPIIFASSFVSLPATIAQFFNYQGGGGFWGGFFKLFSPSSWLYATIYLLLIVGFSYFYATVQFNPIEMANNIKKNGGFIMGYRPGKPTSDLIVRILNKVTFLGAIFLSIIAILPIIMGNVVGTPELAIGGTTVLIVVGVALETVKQLESQMLMRHYKGFLE